MDEKLPEGWEWTTIGAISEINPGIDISGLDASTMVSFVPMSAVEANTGKLDSSHTRSLSEVQRGYTAFQENDVLLAKITPCMENGKFAVAQSLSSRIGFGSTEFHVCRPEAGINPYLLYYYISQESFKQAARLAMTGSAGQLRVPAAFLSGATYPLAPTDEQARIVSAIELQFTRLDAAIAFLKSAQAKTKLYRASLLKAAVEGELTRAWREEHAVSETGEQLLARILAERRARWEEEQLAKMREKGSVPKDEGWKKAYREPQGPQVEELGTLPEGWCWATVEQTIAYLRNGLSQKPEVSPLGYRILRINAVRPMSVNLDEIRYLPLPENEAQDYLIEDGDILFTRYNGSLDLLGVAGMVRNCIEPTLHPDKLIRVKAVIKETFPLYMEIVCNIGTSRAFIESRARTTAGQKGISGFDIKQIPIPLPSLDEQAQIVAEVEARLSDMAQCEKEIEKYLKQAECMRQSILREAFAGRLAAQDARDEPASVLLERIREERRIREEKTQVVRVSRKKGAMDITKKRRARKLTSEHQVVGLYEKLVEVGQPLSPEELFKQVGLKVDDQPESVETFYHELDANMHENWIAVDQERNLLQALDVPTEVEEAVATGETSPPTEASNAQVKERVRRPTLWEEE